MIIPHKMEIQAPDGSLDSCETEGCFYFKKELSVAMLTEVIPTP